MKKREKNYKTLFIVCFSLIAVNLLITGILLFKLNDKMGDFNQELYYINRHIEGEILDKNIYFNSWEDASYVIHQIYSNGKLKIEKPTDWNFDFAYRTTCGDFNFCTRSIDNIDSTFYIGSETTYSEFLQYLLAEVEQVAKYPTSIVKNNNEDIIEFYIDNGSLEDKFEIELNQEDNEVHMTFKYYQASN